jgi:Patatin-like phospholipase
MLRSMRRIVLVVALCAACRTAAPPVARPEFFPAPVDDKPPLVGLVLGGGGARGFAHVGVLRVLEQNGVPVELIVGTSVGSLVGALYAGDTDSRELERIARPLERKDLFDFGIAPALFGTGLASGDRLERFVRDHATSERIEDLRLPYAAVATDLNSGDVVVLRRGDLARAVRASSAIPGVFEPVEIDGRLLGSLSQGKRRPRSKSSCPGRVSAGPPSLRAPRIVVGIDRRATIGPLIILAVAETSPAFVHGLCIAAVSAIRARCR